MSVITGRAKKFDGSAIDYVSIFNWTDGKCIAQVIPDASGNWSYIYTRDIDIGLTYVADGCAPVTHGSYNFLSEWSPLSLFNPTATGVWYDPSDLSTLFKDDARKNQVTKNNDIVRVMLDKSGNNNHARCAPPFFPSAGQSKTTGMRYRTNGTLHWLEPQNDASGFVANPILTSSLGYSSFFALNYNNLAEEDSIYFFQGDYGGRVYLYATRSVDNMQQGFIHDGTFTNFDGVLNINPHLYTMIYDASLSTLNSGRDNILNAIANGVPGHSAQGREVNLFRRGMRYNGKFYGGIMVDNYVATSDDISRVNTYLAQKSGITI